MSDGTEGNVFERTSLSLLMMAFLTHAAFAAIPVVKTVPWVPTNPLIPHDTWSGKVVTLKGTVDSSCLVGCMYSWDFGDGSAAVTGTVSDIYAIEAQHAYAGEPGAAFTARLTVVRTATGETGGKEYYVQLLNKTLNVEVNVAIDEGLWYLHKKQQRAADDMGHWIDWAVGNGRPANDAANVNAFEAHGHFESGDPCNPYVETVHRGLRYLLTRLTTFGIPNQTNGFGTFNPDSNGNGLAIVDSQIVIVDSQVSIPVGNRVMDALIATGTPLAIAQIGPANVVGRTYKDIVQDMADALAYCQNDVLYGGGWGYECNGERNDNLVSQWPAISLTAATRMWGIPVPNIVKDWNMVWLWYSQESGPDGRFGFEGRGDYLYGPYATTASGMVQLAMDGIGRGDARWERAEAFMRNNFANTGNYLQSLKGIYSALFVFTKAMLSHDSDADGVADPITLLRSFSYGLPTRGVPPIDWYAAEASKGASTDGVARTLVNNQTAAGYWVGRGDEPTSTEVTIATAWAIMMLRRTVTGGSITSAVSISISPLTAGREERGNPSWTYVLTITNTAAGSGRGGRIDGIPGPIQVVLTNLSANATLVNKTGTFMGDPFITVQPGPLAPGASASVTLEFTNTTGDPITYTPVAYSGVM